MPRDNLALKVNRAERAIAARLKQQPKPDNHEMLAVKGARDALRVLVESEEAQKTQRNIVPQSPTSWRSATLLPFSLPLSRCSSIDGLALVLYIVRKASPGPESNSQWGGLAIPRILIADDHDVVRQGVRHILETLKAWEIAGEAANGEEAIRLYRKLKPDVVVMDISMPVMNGLDATKEITKESPDSKVLILTMHESPSFPRSIQDSGAKGVVTKSCAAAELGPGLEAIIAGQTYFH